MTATVRAPSGEDRVPYSPIVTRPTFAWPNGARLAVWVVPNVEHYEYLPPVRARATRGRARPHPDVLGYGLRDYGNRVGLWRMFDVMDHFGIRCTISLNLAVFDHYPQILEACERRKWDVMAHGLYNTRYHWNMAEDAERAAIEECVESYRRHTGRQLAGWFSPAATFTLNTPDLVAEAGIKYYCDWYHDDQPFPMRVRNGRLITIPYQMDINDAMTYRHAIEAAEFAQMVIDHFDCVYAEAAHRPIGHVHRAASLHHGAAASHPSPRAGARSRPLAFRRLDGDRRRDRRLVHRAWARRDWRLILPATGERAP